MASNRRRSRKASSRVIGGPVPTGPIDCGCYILDCAFTLSSSLWRKEIAVAIGCKIKEEG